MLLLGIDGGGTSCRARLADFDGHVKGEGQAGPANIRFGLQQSFTAILDATNQCLAQAGVSGGADIVACLALAGASEPRHLAAARAYQHPFLRAVITTDAHAACVGAHGDRDGGVIIVGTGSVGWAEMQGSVHRVGGWGFPVSDEGSGAWLGCEALRRLLWAHDGRIPWTGVLQRLSARFKDDPHAVVRWMDEAKPRDFASLVPLIADAAFRDDPTANELLNLAAGHVDAIAKRLARLGVRRLAVIGGMAQEIAPRLAQTTRELLVAAEGDAQSGALRLARLEAESLSPMRRVDE